MAEAVPTLRWKNLSSTFSSTNRRSPSYFRLTPGGRQPCSTGDFSRKISCKAVELEETAATATAAKAEAKNKKSRYDIENLTMWLLKQEQAGHIDAELTIVLSSISLACKQIASLLQRSSIINLTGLQGTVNVQGEDQKKLDVISNEVCLVSFR